MGEEIRKEVIGLLEKWNGQLRLFVVELVSLLISVWLLVGVLSIGILIPLYVGKSVMGSTREKTSQDQVLLRPSVRPTHPRYERAYEIKANRLRSTPNFKDQIRETRNTVNELKSMSRALAILWKG